MNVQRLSMLFVAALSVAACTPKQGEAKPGEPAGAPDYIGSWHGTVADKPFTLELKLPEKNLQTFRISGPVEVNIDDKPKLLVGILGGTFDILKDRIIIDIKGSNMVSMFGPGAGPKAADAFVELQGKKRTLVYRQPSKDELEIQYTGSWIKLKRGEALVVGD